MEVNLDYFVLFSGELDRRHRRRSDYIHNRGLGLHPLQVPRWVVVRQLLHDPLHFK